MPEEITGQELDREVRSQLRQLSKEGALAVSRHLVAAGELLDVDAGLALEHARAALRRAGRIGVVREAVGIAAYRAGEFAEALRELRAARRITGSHAHLPVMADCERGLGRPERALQLAASPEAAQLDEAGRVEMLVVAAGARRDLGDVEAAVVSLQVPQLRAARASWSPRLWYAYGEALDAAGRHDEAREWWSRAAAADPDGETDAEDRLAELDGVTFVEEPDEDVDDEAGDAAGEAGEEVGEEVGDERSATRGADAAAGGAHER